MKMLCLRKSIAEMNVVIAERNFEKIGPWQR
jgi:hypothetical protein